MSGAPRPVLYGDARRWALVEADALALLAKLPDASVDAVVTDPPYGIDIAGRSWDGADIRRDARRTGGGRMRPGRSFECWTTRWGSELRRVLRPGGHLAAFGAPRTMHRLICGLEEAGLEVRDQLLWLHGQGVPKSGRLAGRLGTTLKPAYEPIVLARAPLAGTVAANLARFGTGALEVEAARIHDPGAPGGSVGRFPANVLLGHGGGCAEGACDEGCPVAGLERLPARPSRFFYTAKASRTERDAGCEELPARVAQLWGSTSRRPARPVRNTHPTVKPLSLMRWLVRLCCPPGGVVLDPFTGSGTTGAAALLEGRKFVGIEREGDYVAIARARIAHWHKEAERAAAT